MDSRTRLAAAGLAATLALGGCGLGPQVSAAQQARTVVVATHDSWAMTAKVIGDFERRTGYHVVVRPQGDAGALTNKLVLTKGAPIADATFGIDNTFATRAVDAGILAPVHVPAVPGAARFDLPGSHGDLVPVDYGDVCANVDDTWFARHHLAPPRTLDDLIKPEYRNLFVTEGATTSSTGLAFLLATIGAKGAGWTAYWHRLMANGTKVDSGWEQAYTVDFTAGGGSGSRPIVMSYASSPPYTIAKGAIRPTTSALLGTCFRQVEYAGVLRGAANPKGAQAFVRFMRGREFQAALPEQMYVYPVDRRVALPRTWSRFAPLAHRPYVVAPSQITRHRNAWLQTWRNIVTG